MRPRRPHISVYYVPVSQYTWSLPQEHPAQVISMYVNQFCTKRRKLAPFNTPKLGILRFIQEFC